MVDLDVRNVLAGLDPELRRKVEAVCRDCAFHEGVPAGWRLLPFQGWRSAKEQERLYREGRTKLLRSKHNLTPARACDVVWWHPGKGWSWSLSLPWHLVASSAKAHGLLSGGTWRKFKDFPHLELSGWGKKG